MKKNINKILIIVATSLVMASCSSDSFNILPNSLDTTESVLTTEQGFRSVLDGGYDYLKFVYSDDTGNMFVVADAMADNLIFSPDGRQTNLAAYEWSYTSTSGSATASYNTLYRVISRANLVLDNINKLPSSTVMANIEAEAKALRGIAHFELVKAFAKIPKSLNDTEALNSLGVAYITKFDPSYRPSRETVAQTYDKIIADLESALGSIGANNGIGRLNKASLNGYLAKVYLYKGDYDKVITYGEACIGLSPSVGTLDNFPKIWKDASQDGVLLSLVNSELNSDNVNIGVGFNQDVSGIRSEFYVNYDLLQQYSSNDVRKGAYFITATYNGTPYNHVNKYRLREGSERRGVVNVKVLRTADIYLTTAEAYYRKGNEVRALELLNKLREQRYTGYTAGTETGTALLDAILKERRLELFAENDRFWTLKRLGKKVERADYGVNVDGTGNPPVTKILEETSYKFVMPIPDDAIKINPKIQQNPGY